MSMSLHCMSLLQLWGDVEGDKGFEPGMLWLSDMRLGQLGHYNPQETAHL